MNGEKRLCTFVQVSDLHFAKADPFTGDSELLNQPPKWDHWHLFDGFLGHQYVALRQFEYAFNELRAAEGARLIITGDMTACAKYDRIPSCNQFLSANEYFAGQWQIGSLAPVGLNLGEQEACEFRIPGNHDHWGGNSLSSTLPGTILGGPTLGFYDAFKRTPFVCEPIALGKDCLLVLTGIDSDADTSDYYRLLARGDFRSQLHALAHQLDKLGRPDGSQVRILLMHHSPMYKSPNPYKDLQITCESREALWKFVREYDIAIILTGHIHIPDHSFTPITLRRRVLESRCGTTMVRDQLPPGWKSPRSPTYELPPDTFLVHRLYALENADGSTEIEWRTDWYLRSRAGFVEQSKTLGKARLTVWPRSPSGLPVPPKAPTAEVARAEMSNIKSPELCSIWKDFARNPANPRAAKIAQQRREDLLGHIYDCDTCSQVRISAAHNQTLIAEFIGLDRTLTSKEIQQIDEMRAAASRDEENAVHGINDLVRPRFRLLENLLTPDTEVTPLVLFQAIQAVTMLAARTAWQLDPVAAGIFFLRDGTLSFSNGVVSGATVIKEIALIATVTTELARKLLDWIWRTARWRPDLFKGFRCEPYEPFESRVLLMVSTQAAARSKNKGSGPMDEKRVSTEDLITELKNAIAALKRGLQKASRTERARLTLRQEGFQGLLRSIEKARMRSQEANLAKTVAPPTELQAKFKGQVQVMTNNSLFKTYTTDLEFELIFSADRMQVSIPKIVINVDPVTVESDPGYPIVGRYDPATGELDFPARFLVTGTPAGDFSFTFDPPLGISTEKGRPVADFQPEGQRLDAATGKIFLAGATTILDDGSIANGYSLMFNALGTINPIP